MPERNPQYTEIEDWLFQYFKRSGNWGTKPTKTREPIYVVALNDWKGREEKVYHNLTISINYYYEVPFILVFYENPMTGWADEAIVIFKGKAIVNGMSEPEPPYLIQDIQMLDLKYIGVDELPPSFIGLFNRCPPEFRHRH